MSKSHLFVGIGDVHLQSTNSRNADRLKALDQIIAENIDRPDLAAWVYTGDTFHGKSSVDDRNAFALRLQRQAQRAPVVIPYGNHETPHDADIFAKLAAAWPIHVIDAPQALRLRLATGAFATLGILPYPHRSGLVAAGVSSPEMGDVALTAFEAIFRHLGDSLEMARAMGDLCLFAGHINVAGSAASTGQPQIGRELELAGWHLNMLGPIPKILGHIHKAQEIHGAHYIGSITAQDFGEIEQKRYIRVHLSAEVCSDGHHDFSIESCPLDTPKLYHVEGRLTREGFVDMVVTAGPGGERQEAPRVPCPHEGPHVSGGGAIFAEDAGYPDYLTDGEDPYICPVCGGDNFVTNWAGTEVRVRYRYLASERSVINEDVIREQFKDAARLHLDPVAVMDRDIRAPQVAAALTLEDKVVAYLETDGKTASPGVLAKLNALQQQDQAAVLADVKALVAQVSDVPAAGVLQAEEVLF